MVRKISLVLFVLLAQMSRLCSQEQIILDSPFIRERYVLLQHITFLFDFLNFDVTQKSDNGREFVKNNRSLYPYNPILSEDAYWCKRIWKEIPMNLPENSHFDIYKSAISDATQIDSYFRSDRSFYNIIRKSIESGEISGYSNDDFYILMEPSDALSLFSSIEPDKIILKEDYWYKKETGEIHSSIIGLGIKDKNDEELWLYYPEVSWVLRNLFPQTKLWNTTWDEVFKKQMYSSVITKTAMADGRESAKCEMSQSLIPPNVELDALVDLKWMKEDYLWNGKFHDPYNMIDLKPKTFELKCLDGSVISGQTENGIWQGEWKRIAPNGNVVVRCQFVNGIPHGKFESYYPEGKIKESGNFYFGLRAGKWNSFFESGKKQSQRNYKSGVMDLKQIYYYENGQKQLEFFYHHGLPNGACKRWCNDGQLFESGELTDGIQSGHWIVNLKLSEECLALFNEFKDRINYSAESLADGILTFDGYIILSPGSCLDCPGQLGISARVSPEVDVYPKLK